jgi:hypothetical protein
MASNWLPGVGTSATARAKFVAATGGEQSKPGPKSQIGKAVAAEKAKNKAKAKAKGKK